MKVITKDAAIENTDDGKGDGPGTFRVILSAPTKDRDGDTLLPDEWKQPLPDHITFDQDHGMSVASTVGSGKPHIDEKGNLIVEGTYSSLPRAQEVRTLVNEGHIKTTSVAFMKEKVPQKDGSGDKYVRELLNGAFVAVPSNREALVLDSKGVKSGARNSKTDQGMIQAIHDHAANLGAQCDAGGGAGKGYGRKDADTNDDNDPMQLIAATDAALDEAIDLLTAGEVEQALAVLQAADAAVDEAMELLGIPDPDDGDGGTETGANPDEAPGAAKAAPGAKSGEAPTSDDKTELQRRAWRAAFGALSGHAD
jgi:hypothetical protein